MGKTIARKEYEPLAVLSEADLVGNVVLMQRKECIGRTGTSCDASRENRKRGNGRSACGSRKERAKHLIERRTGTETLGEGSGAGKAQSIGVAVEVLNAELSFRKPERSGGRINRSAVTNGSENGTLHNLGAGNNISTVYRAFAATETGTEIRPGLGQIVWARKDVRLRGHIRRVSRYSQSRTSKRGNQVFGKFHCIPISYERNPPLSDFNDGRVSQSHKMKLRQSQHSNACRMLMQPSSRAQEQRKGR